MEAECRHPRGIFHHDVAVVKGVIEDDVFHVETIVGVGLLFWCVAHEDVTTVTHERTVVIAHDQVTVIFDGDDLGPGRAPRPRRPRGRARSGGGGKTRGGRRDGEKKLRQLCDSLARLVELVAKRVGCKAVLFPRANAAEGLCRFGSQINPGEAAGGAGSKALLLADVLRDLALERGDVGLEEFEALFGDHYG